MLCSFTTILLVSQLTNILFNKHIIPEYLDVMNIKCRRSYRYSTTSGDVPRDTTGRSYDVSCDQKESHEQNDERQQESVGQLKEHVSVL